ncbi:MAG: sugar phosphate isomerase/epimerase [Akkermansiaceae bacterium]|jgi:sugar phosphate isomerase/epimerase|nr:sugar phosphate isomerase/epimerase [Akkermansiaceae bacterium]
MKHRLIILTLALGAALACARAAAPPFFAMDTGTSDAKHRTAAEQVALVKELGFAGIGPTYTTPENLRGMLNEVDKQQSKLFALYVKLDLDADTPISPQIRDAIDQLRGRDAIIWLWVASKTYKPSDPAGDARATELLREVAGLAEPAGVRIALYPHFATWVERVEDAVRVARAVDRKNLGVTFNLCHWLMVDGTDLGARLKEALPRLFVVTINGAEIGGKNWGKLIQPLDSGNFDVADMLAKLEALGWHGPVGLQHYGIPGDAKDNLQRSMDAWRTISRKVWPPANNDADGTLQPDS